MRSGEKNNNHSGKVSSW